MATTTAARKVPLHFMTLADLSVSQINALVVHAHYLKRRSLRLLRPSAFKSNLRPSMPPSRSLEHKSIALLFSKRSTRTRLSAETATSLLGGNALFLGQEDIQLGVNESLRDSARVISGMCQGIFARVGDHSEIEELARYSQVPVANALSSLWHPTQVLADLLTMRETPELRLPNNDLRSPYPIEKLRPLTIAYVGDSANVLHDMLVSYPRMGHQLRVASPEDERYRAPKAVWDRVTERDCVKNIFWTKDPREAVHGADVVITDTWISMGQEAEKEQRLKDFQGYQVTERLCKEGGAKPNWKFLHCLPRKPHEVDDEVRSQPWLLLSHPPHDRKHHAVLTRAIK
ncbi:mitochondrial ornithine carbamoyltransferase [Fomitopsis serialis]|uniref:mitochondrial ornithine carbamoyltransferase n=1 Tax=Fomitopsis serialis TaxID=139415 RepID=UPI002007890C|nr:mitochondrial ornithine carbamoyltransferase [Neoantrodia serialis]KAH9917790.1 mitochondrial ornithine carbamoyltransferase [Neoantrodia serialis]